MKKILIILLLFALIGCERVYIKDFKIEGIGLGDSLLDFFSKDDIQSEIEDNINKYAAMGLDNKFVEVDFFAKENTYEQLSFFIKPDDPKYIIYNLSGHIFYEKNIDQCYKKLDEIVKEFSSMFKDAEKREEQGKHAYDITGKSIFKSVFFTLNSGEGVEASCYDFDKGAQIAGVNPDQLIIYIDSKEFLEWFPTP